MVHAGDEAASGVETEGRDFTRLGEPVPVRRSSGVGEDKTPLASSLGKLPHLVEGPPGDVDFDGLLRIEQLTRERDEALEQLRIARNLAWSYEHRMFAYKEIGVELDAEGGMVLPHWLTSPAAPYETVYDAMLADFTSRGEGTICDEQVSGLSVGDHIWVKDQSQPDSKYVDVVWARVVQLGDGFVRVQVLRSVADAAAPQEPSS